MSAPRKNTTPIVSVGMRVSLLLVFSASAVFADAPSKRSLILQWRPVRGAVGYVMEVRDAAGRVETLHVAASQAELHLTPGDYSIRLAGLNKFRKPGIWSDWRAFQIAAPDSQADRRPPQRLTLEKLQPHGTSKRDTDGKAGEAPRTSRSFRPAWLLPGLPQWQQEAPAKGALFAVFFFGSLFYAYDQQKRAAFLAGAPAGNPFAWIGALSTVTVWDNLLVPGLLMRQQLRANQDRVHAPTARARAAAGFSFLVYLLHLVDVIWNSPSAAASAPLAPSARSEPGVTLGSGVRLQLFLPTGVGAAGRVISGRRDPGYDSADGRWVLGITTRF